MNNRYLCNSRHFDWIDAVWPRIWFLMLTKSFSIRFMIYFVTKTFRRASSTFISNVLMKIRSKGHEKLIWHFTLHASPATIAVHIVISLHSYEFVLEHDRMTQKMSTSRCISISIFILRLVRFSPAPESYSIFVHYDVVVSALNGYNIDNNDTNRQWINIWMRWRIHNLSVEMW